MLLYYIYVYTGSFVYIPPGQWSTDMDFFKADANIWSAGQPMANI